MSHLHCSKVLITDIELFEQVVSGTPGLKWNHNKKEYRWYSTHKDKCDHAITQTNNTDRNHEVGVVSAGTTEVDGVEVPAWTIAFDPYDNQLAELIGHTGAKLLNAYSEAFALKQAAAQGFTVSRSTDENGDIILELIDMNQ